MLKDTTKNTASCAPASKKVRIEAEPASQSASKGRQSCYFTRSGFCAARGCDPIVIEAFDAPPASLFLPGTGKA